MIATSLPDTRSKDSRFRGRQYEYVGLAMCVVYVAFLLYRVHCHNVAAQNSSFLWGLRGPHGLVHGIAARALGALCESAYFAPVGFASMVVAHRWWRLQRFWSYLPALIAGTTITVMAHVPRFIGACDCVTVISLGLPLLCCLLGILAGAAWFRGWRSCLWFLIKGICMCVLVALGAGLVVCLSLEATPLSFEVAHSTSDETLRPAEIIHSKSSQSFENDQIYILQLTDRDATVLCSHLFFSHTEARKIAVHLDRDRIGLLMSFPLQLGRRCRRYLNLDMSGNAAVKDGILRLHADRFQIGSIEFPSWLLRCLGPCLASLLNHDHRVRSVVEATRELRIEPGLVRITYGALDAPIEHQGGFLVSSIASEELLASTRAQVDHLLLLFAAVPSPDLPLSFNLCLKTTFALARERSAGGDAVVENQAAILALGVLLGHPRIEDLLGRVVRNRDQETAWQIPDYIVLQGRLDWTRHFCVSAAITILSDESTSDMCGHLKEELDTDTGESGFSFADLLVDRAGTVFAARATRDKEAALAMQHCLIGGFHIEDICPLASDLPEDLSDVDLQSCYGGVGGEGYRWMIEEIEQRIAMCVAYR